MIITHVEFRYILGEVLLALRFYSFFCLLVGSRGDVEWGFLVGSRGAVEWGSWWGAVVLQNGGSWWGAVVMWNGVLGGEPW